MTRKSNKDFSDDELMAIGAQGAALWGAECYGFERGDGKVVFECIEHGELFVFQLEDSELSEPM